MRRGKAIVFLGLMAVFLAGCGKKDGYREAEEKYIVGVVAKSSSSEYWMSVKSGLEAAAAEHGMEIVFLSPDAESQKDVQEKMIKSMIGREVDALAISTIDSYHTADYMEQLREKDILAVTFDTGFAGGNLPYIGIDNRKAGYGLAEALAGQMGHKGQIGIVSGALSQTSHRERVEGFQEYMEAEADMETVFIESGYANLQMSEQKVRALMKEYPQVKGIFATSAVTAMGLADALEGSGVKIVTVDVQEDSLEALENGTLSALAAQSGYATGYETVCWIDSKREGKGDADGCYLESEILTVENVEAYRRDYEDKKYPE